MALHYFYFIFRLLLFKNRYIKSINDMNIVQWALSSGFGTIFGMFLFEQKEWTKNTYIELGWKIGYLFEMRKTEYSGSKQTVYNTAFTHCRCTILRRFIRSVQMFNAQWMFQSLQQFLWFWSVFFWRVLPLLFDYIQLYENVIHQRRKRGVF